MGRSGKPGLSCAFCRSMLAASSAMWPIAGSCDTFYQSYIMYHYMHVALTVWHIYAQTRFCMLKQKSVGRVMCVRSLQGCFHTSKNCLTFFHTRLLYIFLFFLFFISTWIVVGCFPLIPYFNESHSSLESPLNPFNLLISSIIYLKWKVHTIIH